MIRVLNLWEGIRKHPSMYIGKKSLYGLQCFITGIMCVERMIHESVIDVDWDAFEVWVYKKLRKKHRSKTSFLWALDKCDGDDEKAFDLWMSWYDEYERKVLGKKEEEPEEEFQTDANGNVLY